jgi:uncharacterized delta-60 repeat protein/uncharacterized repeat protein (TIGR01451 family)
VKRHVLTAALVVAASAISLAAPARAYPGDLDPTFGSGGSVTLNRPAEASVTASSVMLQPDGKVVITFNGVRNAFALRRYLADGTPDTFGSGGTASTPVGSAATAMGAALQPDGKIVAAGWAVTPDCAPFTYTNCASPKGSVQTFALARFAPDGSLDPGFGSPDHGFTGNDTGTVRTLFDGKGGAAHAVAIQPDGKIVAAGETVVDSTAAIAVARYNADGSVDPSFGNDGTVTTPVGTSSWATSLVLQSDGKVLVAGTTMDAGNTGSGFVLARYNTDGAPDTSFGDGGTVTTRIAERSGAWSLVRRPDGRIVAAGFSYAAGSPYSRFALAGYRADGRPDTSFGKSGIVTTAVGKNSAAYALVLQPDGTLVAAGQAWRGEGNWDRMALARYNANGSVGSGFGSGGRVFAKSSGPGEIAYGLVLQPDGKLIGAGTSLKRFQPSQGGIAVYTEVTIKAPEKVTYGKTVTYSVKVANTGTTDAHNVTLTFVVPPGVDTPNIAMAPAGWCRLSRQDPRSTGMDSVFCELGTVAAKGSKTLTITAKPLYASSAKLKNEAFSSTSDREMSPTTKTHAKASVKVVCPTKGSCEVR